MSDDLRRPLPTEPYPTFNPYRVGLESPAQQEEREEVEALEMEWARGLDGNEVGREWASAFLANAPVSLSKRGADRIEAQIVAGVLELEFDDLVVLARDLDLFSEWVDQRRRQAPDA